ncbi:MAG: hypothetical protein ACREPL_14435 [Rhodanobacteraceae bacterium]
MAPNQATPAQAQREKLGAAIRQRGRSPYNLWLVRPPFEARDLILASDLEFEAFYYVEGEPGFADIRYLPQWYAIEGGELPRSRSQEFAAVTTTDGRKVTVQLNFSETPARCSAAVVPVSTHGVVRINLQTLDDHTQRVENWRRVVPCIRRTCRHPTSGLQRQIAIVVGADGKKSLRTVRNQFSDVDAGLFWGAVATILRRRELASDLDSRPWSLNTLVWDAAS